MKKSDAWVSYGFFLLAVLASSGPALAECTGTPGDLTQNGVVDVVDVQCSILSALYEQVPNSDPGIIECLGGEGQLPLADLSCSGEVNVVDVLLNLTLALGAPLNAEVDSNGNGCHDGCEDLPPPAPTEPGAPEPIYELVDLQPDSDGYQTSYGLEEVEGVTVVMLLASW